MSSWSSYLFGYRQRRDHSDVVDLLEAVAQRNWSTSSEDKKEVDDIVKRLRYRHPKTPPRNSRVSRTNVAHDEALQLNVIDLMNHMLPNNHKSTIKIDSSSIPRGELLRDFGGGTSSKCDTSDGTSQGTNESGDDSLGTSSAYTDSRNL